MMVNLYIVEDDQYIQMLYRIAFENSPYHIVGLSDDGKNALDIIENIISKKSPLDGIIFDNNVPLMKGIEVFRQIESKYDLTDIKIIFISGDQYIEQEVTENGAYYIPKTRLRNIRKTLDHIFNREIFLATV